MQFGNVIRESFNTKFKWQGDKQSWGSQHWATTPGGQEVVVEIANMSKISKPGASRTEGEKLLTEEMNVHSAEFVVDGAQNLTGKGEAAVIVGAVFNLLKSEYKRLRSDAFIIGADTNEPSRVKLYKRLIKKNGPWKEGWELGIGRPPLSFVMQQWFGLIGKDIIAMGITKDDISNTFIR